MADIFISYASPNRERARALAEALAAQGWSVWWDRAIVTGQAFDHAIEQALEAARCVVVLWSAEAVASEWVKNEAAAAAERGVLLPARLDDVRLPLEFRRRQTADLQGWTASDLHHEGFAALCQGVRAVLGGEGTSAPLAPPPPRGPRWRPAWTAGLAGAAVLLVLVLGLGWGRWRGPAGGPDVSQAAPSPTTALPRQPAATPVAAGEGAGGTAEPAVPALADQVVGLYVGDVIADSKGPSRSNVAVTLTRLGPNRIRASSQDAHMGSVEIDLTMIDGKIYNAGGDTPFIVDPGVVPATLSLDPHTALAFRGQRRR